MKFSRLFVVSEAECFTVDGVRSLMQKKPCNLTQAMPYFFWLFCKVDLAEIHGYDKYIVVERSE